MAQFKKIVCAKNESKAPGSRQKMAEEVRGTEEIRVSEISCSVYDYPMMEYACDECGARFIDRDENYQYCPHCGRKIGWIVEDSRLHLGDGENG